MNEEKSTKLRELASFVLDPVEFRIFTILFNSGRLYSLTLFISQKHGEIHSKLNFQKYESTLLFQYIECQKMLSLVEDLIELKKVDERQQTEYVD